MSPVEQLAHLIFWIASGILMMAWLDAIWCRLQLIQKRLRRQLLPWALAGGVICAAIVSAYMTIHYAHGEWRVYDVVAQGSGVLLYRHFFQQPIRLVGRVMDFMLLQPVWKILHIAVTFIRLIVRVHVKLVAGIYQLTYTVARKIFPTTLQRKLKIRYTRAKPRSRRKPDEST
ncbi:spore cortex biosynthesis protein YabQ [Chryseomicrobium sp. FSL W7-1435]|uniref:spore cortex biosynthesis protein YabQ n=1 Tax=Chryseomicrobium sp. FSL W7-1435 TaxID=2921704 RepID=UPI0031599D3B